MRTLIKKYIAIKFHIICNSRNVYFSCRLLLNVKMSQKDEMAQILPENVDKAGVNNAPKSERKTRVRYSIFNSKHTTDLWKGLKICGSKDVVEQVQIAEGK